MNQPLNIFHEIPCLTEKSNLLAGTALQKKWFRQADKRYIGQYLQKFISYNEKHFKFLGVEPYIIGTEANIALQFRTSEFIGAIPLRSPDTGKQIGDFVVIPRFNGNSKFAEYIEILDLLRSTISPVIIDSLPLASGRNFQPPMYLEAVKYIIALEDLVKVSWRKFDNVEKIVSQPIGQINWRKYSQQESNPKNRLLFPVKKNILSELHKEYGEIRYVFDYCKTELLSQRTPESVKRELRNRLSFLEEKLYFHKPIYTKQMNIKPSDSLAITKCKIQANKILDFDLTDSTAWRVDFSDVFEKFVQHIFKEVAKENGGKLSLNFKFQSKTSKHYSWELRHLEPDAIYHKNNISIFIDAKYKSHLYNKYDLGETLKDEHRKDLHQILAYSSFNKSDLKTAFLCYPSTKLEYKKIIYTNSLTGVSNTIIICGFPLNRTEIKASKQILIEILATVGL